MIKMTTARRTPVDLDRRAWRLLMLGSLAVIGIICMDAALPER